MTTVSLATMPSDGSAKPRHRRKRILLGTIGVILFGAAWVMFCLVRTPDWYRPPIIPAESQQRVRNKLVAAEQAFTQSLLAGQTFKYHIYQDDINEWLAMRREIYPRVDELAPSTLRDPFVRITPGRIMVAGIMESASISGVLSMEFEANYRDDSIYLIAVAMRCGDLRLPMSLQGGQLDRRISLDENDAWPGSPLIEGNLLNGLRIERDGWWKNGGVDYRVTNLNVIEGQIEITIEPRGRHSREK